MKKLTFGLYGLIIVCFSLLIIIGGCEKENEPNDAPPSAKYIANSTSGSTPFTVSFTDQSINNPTSWQWKFGDGGASTQPNPTHLYNTEGTFTVALTVTNIYGSDTRTKTGYIIVTKNINAPSADFTANTTSGPEPSTITFTDHSTNNPTNWKWSFGDGGTSTQANPAYTYNTEGSFTVSLTASNNYGSDTKMKTEYITISNGGGTGTFTDPRDGQTYNTVEIGSQTWFSENINYAMTDSWWYDNSSANGDIYGRLYKWYPALTACPSGWHLPTDEEWTILTDFLGGENVAGGKMKEVGTTLWDSPNNGATNESGFTALPGGYRNTNGNCIMLCSELSTDGL